jgi:hypothetical protein
MSFLIDLPTEVLDIIIQLLPLRDALSVCLVSQRLKVLSTPHIYKSFERSRGENHSKERLQCFQNTIKERNLNQYVKSIHFYLEQYSHLTLISLLSQTPKLEQLAISGARVLVDWLMELLERQELSLPHLKTFRLSQSSGNVLGIINRFQQLSELSLHNHFCCGFKIGLSASSLPFERVTLDGCDFDTESVCNLIKSCKHLTSFRYFPSRPELEFLPPDVKEISAALVLHKASLEEIVVQNYSPSYPKRRMGWSRFEKTPTFGSFAGFSALKRLGLDLDTIPAQISLPPSLHSISITNCCGAKQSPTMLRRIIEEFPVKCIQVDYVWTAELVHSWRIPELHIFLSGSGRDEWDEWDAWDELLDELEISLHRLPWTKA